MKKIYLCVCSLFSISAFAYDARSYVLMPKDMQMIEAQYSFVDTEKKVSKTINAKNESNSLNLRYLRYFDVGGNLAAAYVLLPYTQNTGKVFNSTSTILEQKNEGLGDVKLFFGLGVYNMPALTMDEFVKHDKNGVKSACSTALTLPTGDYQKSDLFNISSNNKSLKTECILTYTNNSFVAEWATGFTKYTDNHSYLNNKILSKDNMYHTEVHLSQNLNSKMWVGVDWYFQNGGRTEINGVPSNDKLNNSYVGLIGSYNIDKGEYIKVNYIKNVNSPEYTPQTNFFNLTYQKVW